MRAQPDLVEPMGHGKGKIHQTHRGVVRIGLYGDLAVSGNDLPRQLVFQLQHHLGADGPPALLGVLGPAEPGTQGVAHGGDHVVHDADGGQLPPGGVRRNPYSLILLDEVEKAHPDVMHMFLQVLDDGRLTDGQGRTVSFKDTIIIMPSNAGTGKAEASVGFGAAREGRTNSVLGELGNFFSPEFMNRFDGIIEFQALSKDNLLQIVNLMLDDVNQRLATNDIHLDVTEKVKEKLVDLGYDPKMGARPLRRTIQDHIEDAITDFYLENPSEKELKAIMTSNGKILIKSAKKTESTESVNSSQEEK